MGMRFRTTLCLGAAALLVAVPGLAARTYKWVDENGVTHYSQSRPAGRNASELPVRSGPSIRSSTQSRSLSHKEDDCSSLVCRAERLGYLLEAKRAAERQRRDVSARAAAGNQVLPTARREITSEKVERLVAECKARRGANCDSPEEKRRMLLNNVQLTQDERRRLHYLSPAEQRRLLEQRIPEQYRIEEDSTERYR